MSILILAAFFVFMVAYIRRRLRTGKFNHPEFTLALVGLFGVLFWSILVSSTRPNEHPILEIDANQITSIVIYYGGASDIRGNPLGQTSDQSSIQMLEDIFGTCQKHFLNHPRYRKHFTLELISGGKPFLYEVNVDTSTVNAGIDLTPFEERGKTNFILSTYRCEGLGDFLEDLFGLDLNP